jgi:hypothetical protein
VESDDTLDARLSGAWLLVARLACVVGALLGAGAFALGLQLRAAHLGHLASFDIPSGWDSAVLRAALSALGLSVGFYQVYVIVAASVFALCYFIVAALLLWRASTERMALLVALFLLIFGGVWPSPTEALATVYPTSAWVFTLAEQLSWILFLAFFFLFPDGRFVPQWMRWGWVVLAASEVFTTFLPLHDVPLVGVLGWFSYQIFALCALFYRYRHHASPLQRQQIKWAVLAFGVALCAILSYLVLGVLAPALLQPGVAGGLYLLGGQALGDVLFLPIPMCIGIALLRYGLWEVDRLINRVLIYGLLTGLLGAVYAGLIIGLQALTSRFSGQTGQSPLVLVVSTLAIATLVLPVRRHVQALIDRRFYRRKYSAQQALAAFSATLRQEVDLEQVCERLLAVVQETMQPAHISLWLRQPNAAPQLWQPQAATWSTPAPASTNLSTGNEVEARQRAPATGHP